MTIKKKDYRIKKIFKYTRDAPIIPRDAVSRTAHVERTGRHKWVKDIYIVKRIHCIAMYVMIRA